ncbi:MAG TPA: ATP-grasp family protein [Dehalococcoidia bacterium]
MKLKVAVAGVPGAWSSERMREALSEAGVESFVFSLGDCLHNLNSGEVTLDGASLADLDGLVVKKLAAQDDPTARLRLHLLRALERGGVRVFSTPAVIDRVMDRYSMNMRLLEAGLPLPVTYSVESANALEAACVALGRAVVKPVYTSKGRGMTIAQPGNTSAEGWSEGHGRCLVQEFVQSPGRDIGACVLGGRYIGAFYRVAAAGQWMTTTAAGGRYEPCELSAEGIEVATRAAAAFGLDYTIADLVETADGFRIYEVSAFGGFRGLRDSSGFDVAAEYANYIKKELQHP